MEIKIERAWKKDTYTIGRVYVDGFFFGNSMEDTDRGLSANMPLSEIKAKKVYGETAIPLGRYELRMSFSPKFSKRVWAQQDKGFVPEICNVKGFDGIRIHPLNTADDSLGCIGIGRNDQAGRISNSGEYYRKFLDNYILPALKRGESIYVTIK